MALQHYGTTVLWHYSIMALQYYGTTVLWYYSIMALQYYGTTVLWPYCIMVLQYYGPTVLWPYSIMVQQYYGTTASWYYGIVVHDIIRVHSFTTYATDLGESTKKSYTVLVQNMELVFEYWVNSIMSGRSPLLYCTLTLIAMQGHQIKNKNKT